MDTHLQPPPTSKSRQGHVRVTSEDRRRLTSTRRLSKGPLDLGSDPLSSSTSSTTGIVRPSLPLRTSSNGKSPSRKSFLDQEARDLSFLLQSTNFSQIPAPVVTAPEPEKTHSTLMLLVQDGQFNTAANLSAQLIINLPDTSNTELLFSLWYIRLSCLTLVRQTRLAAAESKTLGDLTSSFYRDQITKAHIVPWHLRLLAIRLQALGFGEWRRAIMSYYILAEEARHEAINANEADDTHTLRLWKARLQNLGIMVASALIEMGDLEAAARHLATLQTDNFDSTYPMMECLIWLKVGHLGRASDCIDRLYPSQTERVDQGYVRGILEALTAVCKGDAQAAYKEWKHLSSQFPGDALIQHNLAICSVYICDVDTTRAELEEVLENHTIPPFESLLFNTATLYELSTENALQLKKSLVEKVRENKHPGFIQENSPIDFKM